MFKVYEYIDKSIMHTLSFEQQQELIKDIILIGQFEYYSKFVVENNYKFDFVNFSDVDNETSLIVSISVIDMDDLDLLNEIKKILLINCISIMPIHSIPIFEYVPGLFLQLCLL